jgi:hypothetical protein
MESCYAGSQGAGMSGSRDQAGELQPGVTRLTGAGYIREQASKPSPRTHVLSVEQQQVFAKTNDEVRMRMRRRMSFPWLTMECSYPQLGAP